MPILLGDTDPLQLFRELANKELNIKDIVQKENLLFNLYAQNLKGGSKILRTATKKAGRSWLKAIKAENDLETYINLSVNKAKQAIASQDVLLAGVISPGYNWQQASRSQINAEISESVILLDDFKVDCLLLEGFADINLLSSVVPLCSKLSDLPLACFWKTESIPNTDNLAIFQKLVDDYAVELAGFEAGQQSLPLLKKLSSKSPKGMIIQDIQQMAAWKDSNQHNIWALLAADGISRQQWIKFNKLILDYESNNTSQTKLAKS